MNISQLEDKKAEIADSSGDLVREHGQLEEQVKEIAQSRSVLEDDTLGLELKNSQANKEIEEKAFAWRMRRRSGRQPPRLCPRFRWRLPT